MSHSPPPPATRPDTVFDDDTAAPSSFEADASDHPEAYLDYQATQLHVPKFDVLVLSSLIFHEDRILLIRLSSAVKSWSGRLGGPVYRLLRQGEHGLEGFLSSRIDKHIGIDDEISVDEYVRVAARVQVGMDPSRLRHSKAASALLTAVSPEKLSDTNWLRASFIWSVEEEVPPKVDGYVAEDAFWVSEAEVEKMDDNDFFFGLKEDIQTAFGLRRRKKSFV